jgi:hypothetical protein
MENSPWRQDSIMSVYKFYNSSESILKKPKGLFTLAIFAAISSAIFFF